MRIILDDPADADTPASRVKQLGLMTIIYNMQMADIPTTVSNIKDISHLSRQAIYELASSLIAKKLLQEETVLNATGRGRATLYIIPQSVFDAIPSLPLLPKGK